MREIKVRGMRTERKEWVYGYLIGDNVIVGNIVEFNNEYFNTSFWWKVRPETVGQDTGLKDKNSKEIYEGDIMKIPDLYETPENTSTTYHYQAVIYQEFAFCLGEGNPLYKDHDYVSDECEVVGNIYENPDLMEVAQ